MLDPKTPAGMSAPLGGKPTPPGAQPEVNSPEATPRLALRPRDAAKALGIGERLLWQKTNCGEIPHVRVGKAILYPVDVLRDWLAEQVEGGKR